MPVMAAVSSACSRVPTSCSLSSAPRTSGCSRDMLPSSWLVRNCASTKPSFSRRNDGCDSSKRFGVASSFVGSRLAGSSRAFNSASCERLVRPGEARFPIRRSACGRRRRPSRLDRDFATRRDRRRPALRTCRACRRFPSRCCFAKSYGLAQLGDDAAGLVVAQLAEALEHFVGDGIGQGARSFGGAGFHFQVEHFGRAELGPFRRHELDVARQVVDVLRRRPVTRRPACRPADRPSSARPSTPRGSSPLPAASLPASSFRSGGGTDRARRRCPLASPRTTSVERRLPGRRLQQRVARRADRDAHGRHEPPQRIADEQPRDVGTT